MFKTLIKSMSLTDLLPIAGGASGGAVAADILPSVQSVVTFTIMTILGAILGYFVKLLLDKLFKKKRK